MIRPQACRPWATFETCNILTDWGYVAGDHVRVWYDKGRPEDNSFASDLAREADVKIWPELVRVMGREMPGVSASLLDIRLPPRPHRHSRRDPHQYALQEPRPPADLTGLTDQILDDPQHPYSQLLVSSVLQP